MREIDIQLFNACMRRGNLQEVKELLDKGSDINAKDKEGYTALMVAAWHGHADIAKLLIEKGADVNAKNYKGRAAISYAFNIKDKDKRQELLEIFNHYCPEAFMTEYLDRSVGMGR